MKRILIVLTALVLAAVLLAGGAFAVRKLYAMYGNIWGALDNISAAADKIHRLDLEKIAGEAVLTSRVSTMSAQVEYLHSQAMRQAEAAGTQYDYAWVDSVPPYIAHACGGMEEATYTNSREAFVYNYERGQRVFEIDFNLADDGVLVAAHQESDWRRMTGTDLPYTSENFNRLPLLGKYESLDAHDVVELMAAYPDVYVITDTKATTKMATMLSFAQLVYCAQNTHPEVLERIIPQIYSEEMLPWVNAVYPFRSVIFTLYQVQWTPESVLDFCMNSGVRFITLPRDLVTADTVELWDTLGVRVGVHTVNDPEEAQRLFEMGVDMLYTDFIRPE